MEEMDTHYKTQRDLSNFVEGSSNGATVWLQWATQKN